MGMGQRKYVPTVSSIVRVNAQANKAEDIFIPLVI